jgi:bifunctional UDP-N-acetylglucosamine pyrophosphorylase/glucosamine-1-phosphate N-acetyltransferase
MVAHVLAAIRAAGVDQIAVVVPAQSALIRERLGDSVIFVEQPQPLGTGHAVLQAEPHLRGVRHLLVLNADLPLITAASLQRLRRAHEQQAGALTFLTAHHPDPRGFGRLVRDAEGHPLAVVEEADAEDPVQLGNEVNVGAYCFRSDWLWDRLKAVQPSSETGEIYLTAVIAVALAEDQAAVIETADWHEAIGINDRVQLAEAEAILRQRIAVQHMRNGVTIVDPASTYIAADVEIGADTVIHPNTILRSGTRIGEDCIIGPNTVIDASEIGNACRIVASVLEGARLEDHVEIGPFGHLRPGAYLCRGVHMGNFGEVKNARLGPGVLMGHFSYVGDADIGEKTNIGAGTITCNFDGVNKHRTEVGPHSFIGSDTLLIAPVRLGRESATGAGAVVTKDVPDGFLAVGAPARLRRRIARSGDGRDPAGEASTAEGER